MLSLHKLYITSVKDLPMLLSKFQFIFKVATLKIGFQFQEKLLIRKQTYKQCDCGYILSLNNTGHTSCLSCCEGIPSYMLQA